MLGIGPRALRILSACNTLIHYSSRIWLRINVHVYMHMCVRACACGSQESSPEPIMFSRTASLMNLEPPPSRLCWHTSDPALLPPATWYRDDTAMPGCVCWFWVLNSAFMHKELYWWSYYLSLIMFSNPCSSYSVKFISQHPRPIFMPFKTLSKIPHDYF